MLNTKGLVALTEYQHWAEDWSKTVIENCNNLPETYIAESDFTF